MIHRFLLLTFLLPLVPACRSAEPEGYWWEEGYPYSKGTSFVPDGDGTPNFGPSGSASLGIPGRPEAGSTDLAAELDRRRVRGISIQGEESLRNAVDALRAATGLPLIVDPAAEDAALVAGALFELDLSHELSARDALNLIVEQAGDDVVWTLRHDTVLVTTREKARRGGLVVAVHDVRVLTTPRTDFVAPRIGGLRSIDELEDDDGGSPFGSVAGSEPGIEEDVLVALITESVEPESWDEDGVSIQAENGLLVVVHTAEVHRRVARFLGELGRL